MGKVRGDVHVFGISGLLQMLAANGSDGFLTIQQDRLQKVIEFSQSGIRLLSTPRRTHPLGEILLRTRKVDREQLGDLLAEQKKRRIPLGQLVKDKGLLDDKVINGALREQVAEEIYDLFTWAEAKFTFEEAGDGSPPPFSGPLSAVVLDANMMSLVLEAARRVDELSNIEVLITGDHVVVERLELPAELDDPSLDRVVIEDLLHLVDDEKTVGQIIENSLFPRFTVLRTLYGLVQREVLKLRDNTNPSEPGDTVVLTKKSIRRKQFRGNGRALLLASDLPTYREVLAQRLRSEGYRVLESANHGVELQRIYDAPVDTVILDVSLESADGLAICRKIGEKMSVPMIVLSENSSREAMSNALGSGARYVLVKPFKDEHLLDRLSDVFVGEEEKLEEAPTT